MGQGHPDSSHPGEPPVFSFKRVPFGVDASPFLLNIVLSGLLSSSQSNPWLQVARKGLYVDNLVLSVRDVSQAQLICESLIMTLSPAGFSLRD